MDNRARFSRLGFVYQTEQTLGSTMAYVTLLVEFRRPVSGVGLPCSCDAADFPCASVPRRVEKKAGERVDFEVFSGLNLEEP